MSKKGIQWIRFFRKYGPISRSGNMFDEHILRTSKRTGIPPISFEHPLAQKLYSIFDFSKNELKSVILTGAAGDGKTCLCRLVWEKIGGNLDTWAQDEPYVSIPLQHPIKGNIIIHIIRDLSAWVPQRGLDWPQDKKELLLKFSRLLYENKPNEFYLIAANDGQLIETWRRLDAHCEAEKVSNLLEDLLVNGKEEKEGVALKFFNLSKISSAVLCDRALHAVLSHEGWSYCFEGEAGESITFGSQSPIRRNYELLKNPLVQTRLNILFELCDYNELHIPIREILLLLTNAILGHPDCGNRLMIPNDVAKVIDANTVAKASLYNNIFGGNLPELRQQSIPVFNYFNLFRIGYETTNRIDNLLIFGEEVSLLCQYFKELISSDTFYGADASYRSAQYEYINGDEEDEDKCSEFLEKLVAQRRALYFKIPEDKEEELGLWDLTVFNYAGEYRSKVVQVLKQDGKVDRRVIAQLVKGLNRIWVGMLIDSERDLYLSTGLSFSNTKVSRILEDQISVSPRLGQKIDIVLKNNMPVLEVSLSKDNVCSFVLSLMRFEFLSRVAKGALPNSFSKECYEDVMAFKSQVLALLIRRRQEEGEDESDLVFRLLSVDEHGNPQDETVEALDV